MSCMSVRRRSLSNRSRRDQSGVILMYVLGVVMLLGIVGMALLSYAGTTIRAAGAHTNVANRLREFDGVLEVASQTWRNDEAMASTQSCGGASLDLAPYIAYCSDVGTPTGGAPVGGGDLPPRIMDLQVTEGGNTVARARVRVVDWVNGVSYPGYSLEVCDWQLGSSDVAEPLEGCSA